MMRIVLITAITLLAFAQSAYADNYDSVTLNNHFYTHVNEPGTFYFKDKYGTTAIYGDAVEQDASILSITVEAQGMATGDQIIATSSASGSWPVTPGQVTEVSVAANQTLSIKLIKAGNNEVFAKMDVMRTLDAANGGTYVTYFMSVNNIPTEYGDLGPGSGNGGGDPDIVDGNYYYFAERDLYKYDYTAPSGASRYELHYLYPDGSTQYKRDYEQPPTGIHYLTCNGTYEMRFFDGNAQVIAKSPLMVTTQMVNPTCASHAGDGGYTDFTANKVSNPDGSITLTWDSMPGADNYDIYKDGAKVGDTAGNSYSGSTDGFYSVIAKDSNNEIIGQSDLPPNPTGSGGCGDVCQQIRDALACPEWDQYMGDLTNAIRAALPPPPDWDDIADKIGAATINHLADYMGAVPHVPSKSEIAAEITPPLPTLDTAVPDLDLVMPSGYDSPIDFDITTGQEIPVVDDSESITIYDPDQYINADDPGEMVYPGDSRNHSDGIKDPDTIETEYAQPTPSIPDFEGPPPTDLPIPSGGGSTLPIPGDPGGIIPIPTHNNP